MSELRPLGDDVEEIDGRGLSAIPGLVDCHTHACFAGDRVEEFSLRAGGASYEELHARGGGILSTVRATREAGEPGSRPRSREHVGWMLRAGTTTFEAKSGYGLDRETELAQLRAVRDAGGIPTWLGAHTVPPEFADAGRRRVRRLPPRRGAPGRRADRRGGRRVPRARRLRRRPGSALSDACRARGSRAPPARRPVHGVRRDPARDRARRPLRRPPRGDRAGRDRGACARATSPVSCSRRARSSSNRPMPPARALVDAGAAIALATDFNPGSAFCESLPLVCSLAATQMSLAPEEALAACTVNAAHVLGRAERKGRLAAGLRRRRRPPRRRRLASPCVPPRRAGGAHRDRRRKGRLEQPSA